MIMPHLMKLFVIRKFLQKRDPLPKARKFLKNLPQDILPIGDCGVVMDILLYGWAKIK